MTKFLAIKNSKFNASLNKFFNSPYYIATIGILSLISNIFSLEIVFYILVGITALYICALGDDLLAIMPLFVFCYIAPSAQNNPGLTTNSIFYNKSTIIILLIVVSVIFAVLTRIGIDKNMGYKKLFCKKRALLAGMILLGFAYLMSGVGSKLYFSTFTNNLVFSVLQFLSIFLLYFIFSATINWKNVRKDYFAWIGVIMGIIVALELLHIYIFKHTIQNGTIIRRTIVTGWGHYNNMGALLSMSIPFAFYLCCTKKHNYLYLTLSTILLGALFASCSRGSIVCGGLIYLVSFAITFFKAENKKSFRITSLILIVILVIALVALNNKIVELFKKVPTIINTTSNSLQFNDSSRFKIYKEGFKTFKNYPLFGQSFYPKEYVPADFSIIASFTAFFPPRWHNTIIQILSSCGIFGMFAYIYHRFETVKLIIKKPSIEKTFIGLSIAVLLLMSLLDCHFFNIGPTLIYSMALVFAEEINKTT